MPSRRKDTPRREPERGEIPAPKSRGRAKPAEHIGGGPREGPTSAHHIVGGPRTKFGTRITKRVTCTRCCKSDHVQFVPKESAKVLCRDCAVEVLRTYEEGAHIRMETRSVACNLCGTPFGMPVNAEDDGDPLCPNCLRGFTSWQGGVDTPYEERAASVVEARPSGVLVRKRKKS